MSGRRTQAQLAGLRGRWRPDGQCDCRHTPADYNTRERVCASAVLAGEGRSATRWRPKSPYPGIDPQREGSLPRQWRKPDNFDGSFG